MNPVLDRAADLLKGWYYTLLGRFAPEKLAKTIYRKTSGEELDFDHPVSLNAKINWLKFRSDTRLWTLLADKYRVREFVEKKGLGATLPKLYGMWNDPDEIDFDRLPQRFVLKTNNGSGSVILVKDRNSPPHRNWAETRQQLRRWMKERYGLRTAEMHYHEIPPCVIAEELLDDGSDSLSILDYKVHCCSGEPQCIVVCHDRIGHNTRFTLYENDWTPRFDLVPEQLRGDKVFPKPVVLDEMLEASRILSHDFPFVRVDWYVVDGKLYFGEMTFTPSGGFIGYIARERLDEMGRKVKLPHPTV